METATNTPRLKSQLEEVRELMKDGTWRTLNEIRENMTKSETVSTQSVSARLRDLRKEKFGGYEVTRRSVDGVEGLYEYRVNVNVRNSNAPKPTATTTGKPSVVDAVEVLQEWNSQDGRNFAPLKMWLTEILTREAAE